VNIATIWLQKCNVKNESVTINVRDYKEEKKLVMHSHETALRLRLFDNGRIV